MSLTPAEKQWRYRQKLKENPMKNAEAKQKHLQRYHAKKKLVQDMTDREHRVAKRRWKIANKKRQQHHQREIKTPQIKTKDKMSCTTADPTLALVKHESEQSCQSDEHVDIERDDLARSLLYADHEILDDMVIGPTVLLRPVHHNWLPPSLISSQESQSGHFKSIHSSQKICLEAQESSLDSQNLWSCNKCKMHFKQSYPLNFHKCYSGNLKRRAFSCDICGKIFGFKSTLVEHMLVHNSETQSHNNNSSTLSESKEFDCKLDTPSTCGKNNKFLSHLTQHKGDHRKKDINCKFLDQKMGLREGEGIKVKGSATDQQPNQERMTGKLNQNFDSAELSHSQFLVELRNKLFKLHTEIIDKTVNSEQKQIVSQDDNQLKQYADSINVGNNRNKKDKREKKEYQGKGKYFQKNSTQHNKSQYLSNIRDSWNKHKYGSAKQEERYMHDPTRPFVCDICYKGYKSKQILSVHKVTHSVVKPYSCDICYKEFNQISNLNIHNLNHHKKGKKKK